MDRIAPRIALPALGVCLFVGLWWLLTAFVASDSLLARFAPSYAFGALAGLVGSGEIWPHLISSARRILVGLAVSVPLGLVVGLALGGSKVFARTAGPVFQFVRMISPLSWIPLAIILFGVGDAPVYFLLIIASVWPVALNTSAGVAALDQRWIVVGRSLGATRWEMLTTIVWPGIRLHFLTGIGLAIGISWIVLVPAEMLGVDSGLGYFVLDTRERFAYSELVATMLVIGLCGFLLDGVSRRFLRERRKPDPTAVEETSAEAEPAREIQSEQVR